SGPLPAAPGQAVPRTDGGPRGRRDPRPDLTVAEAAGFLQPLILEYVGRLRHQRRYSEHSCSAAMRDLSRFADYCGQARVAALDQIDLHLVRAFIAHCHRAGAQPASLQRYLSSLRSFFRYQLREGRIAANPAQTVRAPKLKRKLPVVISADVLGAALNQDAEAGLPQRDHAIVELFYSTGLRLAELQSLNLSDVAHGQTEVTITGKGRKQRIVMIGGPARAALDRWLSQRAG